MPQRHRTTRKARRHGRPSSDPVTRKAAIDSRKARKPEPPTTDETKQDGQQ